MSVAIRVENVSKAYQLGEFTSGTLSRDLERWWALYRGKEDPFLKIGEANDRAVKGGSDIVWSLKDLNFEIQKGDAVGIIGKNGAGKSTLLKVLSQVTSPTTGKIKVKGRIASLLEVGTGFHPELTGRENIYLNGAILGMRKHEIARKFDEIVDFSGVERYIDTPVKRYSSGMYVRLAFAVAAHLESEILIVDEVLAVGDAEFQKKCLGKMGEVSKGEGRTVLFVSHNMASINNLCNTGLLLESGLIKDYGSVDRLIFAYLKNKNSNNDLLSRGDRKGSGLIKFKSVEVDISISTSNEVKARFVLMLENKLKLNTNSFRIDVNIVNGLGDTITQLSTNYSTKVGVLNSQTDKITFQIENFNLNPGNYNMRLYLEVQNEVSDWIEDAHSFSVPEFDIFSTGKILNFGYGNFYLRHDYNIE